MTGLYLALLAVLAAGFGARDQLTIAGLAKAQGRRPGVLILAIGVSLATAGIAAWAATLVIPILVPDARLFMAALALAFAGLESLAIAPKANPREPTNSLGALAIVLLANQLTDAARFMIFGIAVGTNAALSAGIGGAVGGAALVVMAWMFPERAGTVRARLLRRVIGGLLLLLAIYFGLVAIDRL